MFSSRSEAVSSDFLDSTTSIVSSGWSALSSTAVNAAGFLSQKLQDATAASLQNSDSSGPDDRSSARPFDDAYSKMQAGFGTLASGAQLAASETKRSASFLAEKLKSTIQATQESDAWGNYMTTFTSTVSKLSEAGKGYLGGLVDTFAVESVDVTADQTNDEPKPETPLEEAHLVNPFKPPSRSSQAAIGVRANSNSSKGNPDWDEWNETWDD